MRLSFGSRRKEDMSYGESCIWIPLPLHAGLVHQHGAAFLVCLLPWPMYYGRGSLLLGAHYLLDLRRREAAGDTGIHLKQSLGCFLFIYLQC